MNFSHRLTALVSALVFNASSACTFSYASVSEKLGSSTSANGSQGNGNIVFFGDSFLADTPASEIRANTLTLIPEFGYNPDREDVPYHLYCLPVEDNYAHRIGQNYGVEIADYSCNGQTAPEIAELVDLAIEEGNLTSTTRSVVIQNGGTSTHEEEPSIPGLPSAQA